jgi:serine/threonine-protein kinase
LLGLGLSGDVYEAVQISTRRTVALKLASHGNDDAAAAIRREAAYLARLEHPAVVPLVDAGVWRSRPFAVLAYARGGTLSHRSGTPWGFDAALRMLGPLASALDAIHAAGLVHRDVCARNVLLDGAGRPWLADFSVAIESQDAPRADADGVVVVVGTTGYLAPEVARGEPPSPASDQYALAVLAYLLLCGVLPGGGSVPEGLPIQPDQAAPRPPSAIQATLPAAVDEVTLRALSPTPASRFESASAFVDALAAAQAPPTPGEAAQATQRRASPDRISDEPAGNTLIPSAPAGPLPEDVASVGARLEQFAAALPPEEQAALMALLRRAEASVSRARAELQDLGMHVFGPAAALLALEDTGIASLLARGPDTAAGLAREGGGPEARVSLLLDYLVQQGVVTRSGEQYALPPAAALVYRSVGAGGHLLRAAWSFWAHLPARVQGAAPVLTMDTPDGSVYEETVGVLADFAAAAAQEAAQELGIGGYRRGLRVLDVGAGSGIWSRAMAQRDPMLRVTALDRPLVLEVARRYAVEAGTADRLTCLSGDMHAVDLPKASFDLAILANVLHLEPAERIVPLLRRLRGALAPRGELAIIDSIHPDRRTAPDTEQLMALHLLLRTPGGTIHDEGEYRAWLHEAGFREPEVVPLSAGDVHLCLLLAARGG